MRKVLVCSLVVSSLLLFTGCDVLANGKSVHVINDDNDVSLNKVAVEKISHYKDMVGVDWLDNDQLLSENLHLQGDTLANVDLNQFDLNTGKAKLILGKQDFIEKLVLSPDKKHLLCKMFDGKQGTNYIIDLTTKKRVQLKLEGSMDTYGANWIDNQHVMVSNDFNKTYIADVTGKLSELKTPYKISSPIKIKDELYFNHENIQLNSFNLKTKKTKVLVNNELDEFTVSPKKDKIAVVKINKDGQTIVVMNVTGGKQTTIASEKLVGGIGWSPDQSKLAYFTMKSDESQPQLNVTDLKTLKTTLLSVNIVGFFKSSPVIWSPSGDKLLINSVNQQTGAPGVDILTLKK